MIKSASTICFRAYSLEEALRGVAEAGFTNVELGSVEGFVDHLDPERVGSEDIRGVRDLLARFGLRAVSTSAHTKLEPPEGFRRLEAMVHVAGELGMLAINTLTLESDDPAVHETYVTNARKLGDAAAAYGLAICLENEGAIYPTAQEGASLLREIDHPHVKMNFDPANVVYFGGSLRPEDDVRFALPYLGHMHLKDKRGGKDVFDFPPVGEGELDLRSVLDAVRGAGFGGPISLEVEYTDLSVPWQDCRDALARGKAYWDTLDRNAAERGND